MKKLLNLVRNKYFIASVAFATWMLFFDHNDVFSQWEYRTQVNKLKEEKAFYEEQTAQVQKELEELSTNKESFERFARERYLMKKQNEDLFVIVEENPKN